MLGWDVGDDDVLPDGEAKFAGAEAVGDVGEGKHLGDRELPDRDRDADVVQAGLGLRMNAEVSGSVDVVARFAVCEGETDEGKVESAFGFGEKAFYTPAIDEVLEAGFFPVGAVAVLGEDTDHGGGDGYGLVGAEEQAAVGRELLVAGDAAEEDAEVDAGGDAVTFVDAYGDEADVVGVGDDADGSAVVEGDVELTGEAKEIARVEDVEVEGFGEVGDVVKFGRVDASDGGGGAVADIVCAGTTGGHAKGLNSSEDTDDVLGLELTDLEVAAGCDVAASRAPVLGHLGEASHLVGRELAAGDAHP